MADISKIIGVAEASIAKFKGNAKASMTSIASVLIPSGSSEWNMSSMIGVHGGFNITPTCNQITGISSPTTIRITADATDGSERILFYVGSSCPPVGCGALFLTQNGPLYYMSSVTSHSLNGFTDPRSVSSGNGLIQGSGSSAYYELTINNNDYVCFINDSRQNGTIVELTNQSNGGIILGSFSNEYVPYESPCYLTTTMVNHYGYEDDGPELTALRTLREIKGEKYQEALIDYRENSVLIVDEIIKRNEEDYWYDLIKQEVLKLVPLVQDGSDEKLEEAAQIYLDLYRYLKKELLNIE